MSKFKIVEVVYFTSILALKCISTTLTFKILKIDEWKKFHLLKCQKIQNLNLPNFENDYYL